MKKTDEKALDAAVEYLSDFADRAAEAFAARTLAEHFRRAKRAELVLKSPLKTQGLREAWAESNDEYLDACRAEARAVKEVEWHRHQMARAKAILDLWRSQNATEREFSRNR